MNKGFTLIELIGVIVLISLMVLIIVPVVDKSVKKGQTNIAKTTKENIITAARNWGSDNKDKLPTIVTLKELENEGYIDIKQEINACINITENEFNSYDYQYEECKGDNNEN